MRHRAAAVVLAVAVSACGSPSMPDSSQNPPAPRGDVTIAFGTLIAQGAPVTTYAESGFTLAPMFGGWIVSTSYGHPAPFIQFLAPAGTTVTGEIRVTAGGAAFAFKSIDVYSSTTRIPYTITGLRQSATKLVIADTLPNTFGNFATIAGPSPPELIDMLVILLSNSSAPCCQNPMGVDNIVLTR